MLSFTILRPGKSPVAVRLIPAAGRAGGFLVEYTLDQGKPTLVGQVHCPANAIRLVQGII